MTLAEQNALVEANLDLPPVIARLMNVSWREHDDYVACGMLGLVKAARRFDEVGVASFRTFANYFVRGEMMDKGRRDSMYSRRENRDSPRVAVPIDDVTTWLPAGDWRVADRVVLARELMSTLSLREKKFVEAHYLDDMYSEDVARAAGVSPGLVSQVLSRALEKMYHRARARPVLGAAA